MTKKVLYIEAKREGYSPDQCGKTMTVGELIEMLQEYYNEETEIYLSHDNGYTFGSINETDFEDLEIYDE
jgi:hypothetical protein